MKLKQKEKYIVGGSALCRKYTLLQNNAKCIVLQVATGNMIKNF